MTNFGWNYPPGVTGNESAISGEYDIEAIDMEVSDVCIKIRRTIDDLLGTLDDFGCLTESAENSIDSGTDDLCDALMRCIPEEPDYEPDYQEDYCEEEDGY
jgi:hypothetical protein